MREDAGLSAAKTELLRRWRTGGALLPPAEPAIEHRPYESPLPLSLAQQRLWFLERLQPATPAYNLAFCGRLPAGLDPALLARSVDGLVDRHEMLRTTFGLAGGSPVQAVDAGGRPALAVVDLRDRDPQAALAGALERIDDATHEPFDLERGPLARILLCRGPADDLLGIVIHHLAGDGFSLGIALRELSALYEAHAAGRPPALPALPIQYGDFARWQREHLADRDWEEDLAYWREQLSDAPPLELPTDRPRPPVLSLRGDWRRLRLDRDLSDGLRALARAEGATLFVVMLAALQLLLGGLSGQSDVTLGTAVAGRGRRETLGLIGNFANMLALRTELAGARTFRELLGRVRETARAAFAHERVPFERLVEEVQPARDLSRHVLFQAMFILQPPVPDIRFAGRDLELVEMGPRAARADLELHLWDQPELVGRVAFGADLFEAETVERLVARFEALLRAVVELPDQPLAAIPLLLPSERRLLDRWDRGPDRDVPPACVPELIARQAAVRPDATAVVAGEEALSYADLDQRANRLAHHLVALGAGPEVRVGVCLERSVEMVVAVLAVMRAGAAYVPLDPRYPAARLAFMVRDARAPLVVSERALAGLLGEGTAVVRVDDHREAIASRPGTAPAVELRPDQLAYVIYTSGSTGRPKGVQVAHRSLANLVHAMRERPGLEPDDVVASVASLSFDASVAELYPTLACGACLVVASAEDALDGRRLLAVIRRRGVTAVQATATTWRLLQEAGGLDDRGIRALCGGEATTPDLAETLAARHEAAWNMYGPTECTVWATADRLGPGRPVALGQPLANMQVHLADPDLRAVPPGVVGEVCIGGAGLSRGYLERPGLTADRFVPDPFSAPPGARLYRTGDLARHRADGSLEFLGRRDDQVKLRGHRIEMGEVEAALASHPLVEQAVVVLRPAARGGARLVAYVVPAADAGEAPTGPLLGRVLAERLPQYMVPSAFVFLPALPTTPTGKVDRRQLPEPESGRPDLEVEYVAPRTERERELADLTAEFLGLDRVGARDDFFELGGHSLLGAQLITELQRRHGVELALQELFITPTVEHLAAHLDAELARERRFSDPEERLRRTVDRLPEATLDSLLAELIARGS